MAAAVAIEVVSEFEETEQLLYQWGDEVRSKAEELGMPTSSGIAAMIAKQRVFESKRAARNPRKRRRHFGKLYGVRKVEGNAAIYCYECRLIFAADECPRCAARDAKDTAELLRTAPPSDAMHGVETRSFKPRTLFDGFSGSTTLIEPIVLEAPKDWQKVILRKYLYLQRDALAAQQMRLRKSTYMEWVAAAVEHVAERLAFRAVATV